MNSILKIQTGPYRVEPTQETPARIWEGAGKPWLARTSHKSELHPLLENKSQLHLLTASQCPAWRYHHLSTVPWLARHGTFCIGNIVSRTLVLRLRLRWRYVWHNRWTMPHCRVEISSACQRSPEKSKTKESTDWTFEQRAGRTPHIQKQ
jgi:hypothetical protein